MKLRLVLFLVTTAVAAVLAAPSAVAAVKIFHIQYNSPGRDSGTNRSLNLEYVYLWNTSTSRAVQLRGWTVRDQEGNVYRFPRYRLGPAKYVAVLTGRGRNRPKAGILYWGRRTYVWDNKRDGAILRKPSGRTVDLCSYRGTAAGGLKCYADSGGNL